MDEVLLKKIIESYGTPNYIFFQDQFRQNLRELDEAYRAVYPRFQIAYSFKTNYMPFACRTAQSCGTYAEVVSDLEYHMAKRHGFPPDKIIVNGPGKWNGLEEMLSDGAIVMLDNRYEAEKTAHIAESLDYSVSVGFRLNFTIGTGKESRFGFDTEDRKTEEIISYMRKRKNIRIVGLHFHLSGARSLKAWENRAQKLITYADQLLVNDEKKILDLGSGMFGHLDPKLVSQFEQEIPAFDEYAAVVAGTFAEHFSELPEDRKPLLIVEPGTTVIANTMMYATRVIAEKTIRGRKIAIVDGSVHQLGEMGKKKKLPVRVLSENNTNTAIIDADITGYTCLEDDILYKGLEQEIHVGDVLCFGNAGAYTNVLKPPFIQAGCGIVAIVEDSGARLVKRTEKTEDFLASYIE